MLLVMVNGLIPRGLYLKAPTVNTETTGISESSAHTRRRVW